MNGHVDRSGRALLSLRVRPETSATASELIVWVDTAFTGELVIPYQTIVRLGLPQSSVVMAGLADGTEVVLDTYRCILDWFGEERLVQVIESNGQFPLLGVGLLRDHRLDIDYQLMTVLIEGH